MDIIHYGGVCLNKSGFTHQPQNYAFILILSQDSNFSYIIMYYYQENFISGNPAITINQYILYVSNKRQSFARILYSIQRQQMSFIKIFRTNENSKCQIEKITLYNHESILLI